MASGDTLFVLTPLDCTPPATLFATFDIIADTSTPALSIPVLDFDGATQEHMDWFVTIPSHYAGTTGFTFSFKYAPDGTAGGTTEFELRALHLDDLDILTGDLGVDTQTATTITDTAPATPINKLNYSTTGTMAKANFGSAVAGDRLVIRCSRDPATDTNTDDAQLAEILVTET